MSTTVTSVEEIQQHWHELTLRVAQLEAERGALEKENKALRGLLERVIEHRQKSHSELVLILSALVSKLPLNDVGVIVSKLVEHNTHTGQYLAALVKGTTEPTLPQPEVLKTLDQSKRDLAAAVKGVVAELLRLEPPLESGLLESLLTQPAVFFSPRMVRANRCFIKGYVPRERILREFGPAALPFFDDLTTDAKLNPHPKADEIVLGFKTDFETRVQSERGLVPEKLAALQTLHRRVQLSKAACEQARAQKNAFQRLSFLVELLHYYEHQDTEAPDVLFAQRLPSLVEQLVLAGPHENLEEPLLGVAEGLLALVINPDHRQMIINNVGKGGTPAKTLRFVLKLRTEQAPTVELYQVVADFVRHLIPSAQAVPPAQSLTPTFRLIHPEMQRRVVKAILGYDRIRKDQAEALGQAIAAQLGLQGIIEQAKAEAAGPILSESERAWAKIKELVARRADPAAIAAAIRERLHANYDAEELKRSWLSLLEADPMSLIRIFCQIPYLPDGKTDPLARPLIESCVIRLTHEKYAATYHKVVNSLKNMFAAKPDSPTLLTFMALVRWANSDAANKLCADVGMPARNP